MEGLADTSLYMVRYTGAFGFIKPWTAVRDSETYSQQFLTPSIVEGMRQKLEVSVILRHRLTHAGFSVQQERTQSAGWAVSTRSGTMSRSTSILNRGVLLAPVLHLAFDSPADAEHASTQHLCLCRNEDLIFPHGEIQELSAEEFSQLRGFELRFGRELPGAFLVGYNRFQGGEPMYGALEIVGNPTEVQPSGL
jgi:hypothetical protein